MQGKFRTILAMLLVIGAAGVTTYNVDLFLPKNDEANKETADVPGKGTAAGGVFDPAMGKGPESPPSSSTGLLTPVSPPSSEENASEATDPRSPLGAAWKGTVWEELLRSFQSGGEETNGMGTGSIPAASDRFTLTGDASRKQRLEVRGILKGDAFSAALINGEVYRPGEVLPGTSFQVERIEKGFVILRNRGGRLTIEKALEPRSSPRPFVRDREDAGGMEPADVPGSAPASEEPSPSGNGGGA